MPPSFNAMPREGAGRANLLEIAEFVAINGVKGLKSRARSRGVRAREVALRVNYALSALKQLWSGVLTDELIKNSEADWEKRGEQHRDGPVTGRLREAIGRAVAHRLPDSPTGAVASSRRQGSRPKTSLQSEGVKKGKEAAVVPKKGQIWLARVADIALPEEGRDDASASAGSLAEVRGVLQRRRGQDAGEEGHPGRAASTTRFRRREALHRPRPEVANRGPRCEDGKVRNAPRGGVAEGRSRPLHRHQEGCSERAGRAGGGAGARVRRARAEPAVEWTTVGGASGARGLRCDRSERGSPGRPRGEARAGDGRPPELFLLPGVAPLVREVVRDPRRGVWSTGRSAGSRRRSTAGFCAAEGGQREPERKSRGEGPSDGMELGGLLRPVLPPGRRWLSSEHGERGSSATRGC